MVVTDKLRPGVTNPKLWRPARPSKSEWKKIRKVVLERDGDSCYFCGHKAAKYMNVHHLHETSDHNPDNLVTICVACHAVMHMGRNLSLKCIEIWESDISQVEIVRATREGIAAGNTLEDIKAGLPLRKGELPPDSIEWANGLLRQIGDAPRAWLPEPLCAVFVKFTRWQIEDHSTAGTIE